MQNEELHNYIDIERQTTQKVWQDWQSKFRYLDERMDWKLKEQEAIKARYDSTNSKIESI